MASGGSQRMAPIAGSPAQGGPAGLLPRVLALVTCTGIPHGAVPGGWRPRGVPWGKHWRGGQNLAPACVPLLCGPRTLSGQLPSHRLGAMDHHSPGPPRLWPPGEPPPSRTLQIPRPILLRDAMQQLQKVGACRSHCALTVPCLSALSFSCPGALAALCPGALVQLTFYALVHRQTPRALAIRRSCHCLNRWCTVIPCADSVTFLCISVASPAAVARGAVGARPPPCRRTGGERGGPPAPGGCQRVKSPLHRVVVDTNEEQFSFFSVVSACSCGMRSSGCPCPPWPAHWW